MKKMIIVLLSLVLLTIINSKTGLVSAANEGSASNQSYVYMTEEDFNNNFEQFESDIPSSSGFSMITYFQNLYTYSPVNSYGSCGYVSFIQYLSYLDTFINDDFIPTIYERNQGNVSSIADALSISPGVLRKSYPNINLYTYIQNNKSIDFQMYLMDIVNSYKGYSANAYSYKIGMWEYYIILNALFPSKNVVFSYTRVKDIGNNVKPTDIAVINWFDSYVKGQLDLGYPVVLHIADYNETTGVYEDYHSVVAYYYDANGIHANFGWGSDSTDVVISSEYQITEAGVIDLSDIAINHSNNYIINNIEYCGCGMPKHSHNYEDHYCTICNDYTAAHDYHEPYVWLNYTQHKATCGCGATSTQGHAVASNAFASGRKYATCLICGGLAERGFIQFNILSNEVQYVTDNGSYILPNGVIVLVNDDVELYLNATLIFYKKNSQLLIE